MTIDDLFLHADDKEIAGKLFLTIEQVQTLKEKRKKNLKLNPHFVITQSDIDLIKLYDKHID